MGSNHAWQCSLGLLFRGISLIGAARPAPAQQEFYHPGETYDSLQAGQDAYLDAEAQRRALVGRQLMVEDQIMQQNTWLDPQDKYRPVRPESYGPILPKYRVGPTLADVYAYPPTGGGPVYYGGTPFTPPLQAGLRYRELPAIAAVMMPRPCPFFSLGRGCRTIFGGLRTMGTCGSRLGTLRSGPAGSATFTNRSTPRRQWKVPQPAVRHGRSGTAGRCPNPRRAFVGPGHA